MLKAEAQEVMRQYLRPYSPKCQQVIADLTEDARDALEYAYSENLGGYDYMVAIARADNITDAISAIDDGDIEDIIDDRHLGTHVVTAVARRLGLSHKERQAMETALWDN